MIVTCAKVISFVLVRFNIQEDHRKMLMIKKIKPTPAPTRTAMIKIIRKIFRLCLIPEFKIFTIAIRAKNTTIAANNPIPKINIIGESISKQTLKYQI